MRVSDITHIYHDDKQNWYPLRHKISPLLLIAGSGYLVLNIVNSREIRPGHAGAEWFTDWGGTAGQVVYSYQDPLAGEAAVEYCAALAKMPFLTTF